ncbi:MAG: WecB/TagA/CpsF family glycosyltransferase [Chitinophagaceae bacterium]
MKKVYLLGMSLNTGSYSEFVNQIIQHADRKISEYTCLANVHMLIEAYIDYNFARVVNNANIITPDGKPLAWALRFLYGIRQERAAGMDLLPDLLYRASVRNLPVYFYGGTRQLLDKTLQYINEHYPNLVVGGSFSPPFRKLTVKEEDLIIEDINNSGAHLVFVILGCPKQEKWMASMKGRINSMMVGVGGALSVMIGNQRRAPGWMQNAGLEWMFRFLQEPVRLFKRYSYTNSIFLYLLVKEYVWIKLFK